MPYVQLTFGWMTWYQNNSQPLRLGCWMALVAICAMASDWSCGRCRGNERATDCLIKTLEAMLSAQIGRRQ